MNQKEYIVDIGKLKVKGSAEEIHKLAHIYRLAACEYGNQIVEEIYDKHRNNLIAELESEQKELENIEKQLIDTICNSNYYINYSAKMCDIIDDILDEIETEH